MLTIQLLSNLSTKCQKNKSAFGLNAAIKVENMKLVSNNLSEYLAVTPVIDWNVAIVANKAKELTANLQDDVTKAQHLFEWVRDNIPHSKDIDADVVTCSASEVLEVGTGICFAKSHLLAAMLRAVGIPTGFCYQVCVSDDSKTLHGLNGIYLASINRWIRVDPRGNTGEIDAQFDLKVERLAFPPNAALGEFVYEEIWANPVPEVIAVLTKFKSRRQMWKYLPMAISGV